MSYAVRLISAFGIASILSAGAFDLLPGQPPYKIRARIVDTREWTAVEPPNVVAHSSGCNGLYDILEFRKNGNGSMYYLGFEIYEEDVRDMANFYGLNQDYLSFENCNKPSKNRRPVPNIAVA